MKSHIKEQLEKILLMPIYVDKLGLITKEKKILKSSQIYRRASDPDMSDLAVAFYEIIYKNILPINEQGKVRLLSKYDLKNRFFAGDTMNSFNTIAGNMIHTLNFSYSHIPIKKNYWMPDDSEGRMKLILESDAKKSTKELFLKYYYLYHSLANFWVIPMEMGRMSSKKMPGDETVISPQQDYMEKFLKKVKEKWDELANSSESKPKDDFLNYFRKFNSYEDFLEKHIIEEGFYSNSPSDKTNSKGNLEEEEAVCILKGIITAIENRAKKISESEYADDLYNSFKELNLTTSLKGHP